ncbi:MAG: HAD family hydrolase [bacterium]
MDILKIDESASENVAPDAIEDNIFDGSEIQKLLSKQSEVKTHRTVIITDIDNSFYRPDMPHESQKIFHEATIENTPVIAITGGNIDHVISLINLKKLPRFHVVASSVGTTIWVLKRENGGLKYERDRRFENRLIEIGFVRENLLPIASEMIDKFRDIFPWADLAFQQPEQERERLISGKTDINDIERFRITFYFRANNSDEIKQISDAVSNYFSEYNVIICQSGSREDQQNRYELDLVPVTKVEAANYLVEELGIDQGLVAGDSANDVEMLLKTKKMIPVVVGGAQPELKTAIEEIEKTENMVQSGSFFYAKVDNDNKLIYVEKGNRKGPESIEYAAEVLQRASERNKIEQENAK